MKWTDGDIFALAKGSDNEAVRPALDLLRTTVLMTHYDDLEKRRKEQQDVRRNRLVELMI